MNIKEAMALYAPELANDYSDFVLRTFRAMQEDLGPELKGVYSSYQWARVFRGLVRDNVDRESMGGIVVRGAPYTLDVAKLSKNAKRYGERVALEWQAKLVSKLGDLSDVDVSPPRGDGHIILTGRRGSDVVRLEQQRIINVSPLGTLFHQFPSRIYVNGGFVSEAAYKELQNHDASVVVLEAAVWSTRTRGLSTTPTKSVKRHTVRRSGVAATLSSMNSK